MFEACNVFLKPLNVVPSPVFKKDEVRDPVTLYCLN